MSCPVCRVIGGQHAPGCPVAAASASPAAQAGSGALAAMSPQQLLALVANGVATALKYDRDCARQEAMTEREIQRERDKGTHPFNSGTTGQAIVTAATTQAEPATVLEQDYEARPYEGCEGQAVLVIRVLDQPPTGTPRPNGKLMCDVRCGTGTASVDYIGLDCTRGHCIAVPGAGAVSIHAYFQPFNAAPIIIFAPEIVQATISWHGGSRIEGLFSRGQIAVVANVRSAATAVPEQARFALAATDNPARSGNLRMDISTDALATDIVDSTFSPDLNARPLHSGGRFVTFFDVGGNHGVIPLFETW